jgi:hypothetical protein
MTHLIEDPILNADLRERIESLHGELSQLGAVDAQSRTLLITLLADITRLLEKSGNGASEDHTLVERLDELAVQFEAEHPSLGNALRRVVDALSKAGI